MSRDADWLRTVRKHAQRMRDWDASDPTKLEAAKERGTTPVSRDVNDYHPWRGPIPSKDDVVNHIRERSGEADADDFIARYAAAKWFLHQGKETEGQATKTAEARAARTKANQDLIETLEEVAAHAIQKSVEDVRRIALESEAGRRRMAGRAVLIHKSLERREEAFAIAGQAPEL